MNYEKNKKQIQDTLDNPGLFHSLQAELAGKTKSDTPLLLLPLRLETRFMRVRKNLLEDALSPEVATAVRLGKATAARIKDYAFFGQYDESKALLAASLVRQDIEQFRDALSAVPGGNFLEKNMLRGFADDMELSASQMTGHLRTFLTDGSAEFATLGAEEDTMLGITQQLRSQLDFMPESIDWVNAVGTRVQQLVNKIMVIMNDNETALNSGMGADPVAQTITSSMAAIGSELRGVPEYSTAEKLAVLQQLEQLNAQITTAYQRIEAESGGDPALISARTKGMLAAAAAAADTWQAILAPGLERDRFVAPVADAHIIPEDHAIPGEILTGRDVLSTEVAGIRTYYQQLTENGAQWNPAMESAVLGHLSQIGALLAGLPAVEDVNDQRILYQGLEGLNDLLYGLLDWLKKNPSQSGAETTVIGTLPGFYLAGSDIYDAQGNPVSPQGGYGVSADGAISRRMQERISMLDGYGVNDEGFIDQQGRPLSLSGGYFLDEAEGFIITPEGELFSNKKGFSRQENFFFDAAGNQLSPAGGYGLDDARHLVATSEMPVTGTGLFQEINGKFFDMEGQDLSAGVGYGVNENGFITKTTGTVWNSAGSGEAIGKAALGLGHDWARVVGKAQSLKSFDSTYEVDELWIRAYPDDIFITQLEEALTQSEHDAGVEYWNAWWAANGVKELQLLAWQDLVRRFGPQRAAWIVRQLTPGNFSNLPAVETAQQLNAQAMALQTFTAQIGAVSTNAEQQQSIPYYLSIFDEHVAGMQVSAGKLQGSTEALLDLLSDNVENLDIRFAGLAGQLSGISSDFGAATLAVSRKISTLKATIGAQNNPGNWAEMFAAAPAFPTEIEIKTHSWTEQSYSETLPHRLLFSTINQKPRPDTSYTFNHIKIGNVIPDTVYTSIKPDLGSLTSPNAVNAGNIGVDKGPTGELIFDASIKWMFDYNEAVAKGMACSIRLTTEEAKLGFNTVLVAGVKTNEGNAAWSDEPKIKAKSKQLLEKLLTGHLYSEGGMELLRLGTPTNNTDDSDAGFNQPDPYSIDSFNNLASTPLFYGTGYKLNRKDGQWISDLLGVDYSVFAHVKGAGQRQISNAIAMNRALWSATAGCYMDEMLGRLFPSEHIERTRDYFTDYVLARGMMPSLRVGKQPYGVLATTSFTKWYAPEVFDLAPTRGPLNNTQREEFDNYANSPWPNNPASLDYNIFYNKIGQHAAQLDLFMQWRFDLGLERTLQTLSDIWLKMFEANAMTIDKINSTPGQTAEDRQRNFMTVLGTDATLSEAHVRLMLNASSYKGLSEYSSFTNLLEAGHRQLSLDPNGTALATIAGYADRFKTLFYQFSPSPLLGPYFGGNADPVPLYIRSAKIFSAQQMQDHFYLKTPRIDELLLSEESTIGNIPSLGKNYIQWLLDSPLSAIWNNNKFDKLPARSLLFQLLRQSMLLTYRNEALNIMEQTPLLSKHARNIIGTTDGFALQLSHFSDQRLLTKWHLAFNSLEQLVNDPELGTALTRFLHIDYANAAFTNATPLVLPDWKDINISNYLRTNSNTNATLNSHKSKSVARINTLKESFNILKKLPTAELDRLLSEHIDLCSYRLDAWNYGKVHKRLLEQRGVDTPGGARKTGSYLGAYGWLLEVRPKSPGLPIPNVNAKIHPLLQSAGGTVTYDRLNLGFIHTPSMSHAITAAMMRSGFVSERLDEDSSFSINLTSQRVSTAIGLLEGMRNGQTLSELLGYEFEKGLFERGAAYSGLQEYVAFFRKAFPLIDDQISATPIAPAESIRPTNVCDGIDLLNSFKGWFEDKLRANPTLSVYELFANNPFSMQPLLDDWIDYVAGAPVTFSITFGSSSGAALAFITEIDRLANALDAVGDLALTEGVLQISKGNNDRSAAVMESLTEGKNMPELEVTETPRTGYRISNRLLSLMNASQWIPPKFTTPKSSLEPKVNGWIESLLMNYLDVPDIYLAIGCRASFTDSSLPQNQNPVHVDVLLNDLGINAIELAYMMQAGSFLSELGERAKYVVRRNWSGTSFLPLGGIPASIEIEVDLAARGSVALVSQNPAPPVGTITFAEIAAILDAIRSVLANARALSPDDFVFTAEDATSALKYDLAGDVLPRVNGLKDEFSTTAVSSVRSQLDARINLGPAAITSQADLDDINQILLRSAGLGISIAIPRFVKEDASIATAFSKIAGEVYRQLQSVQAEMARRDAQIVQPAPAASEDEQLAAHNDTIAALLGGRFLFLPKFRFAHYAGLESLIYRQLRNQRPADPAYNPAEDLLSHLDPAPGYSETRRDEIMDDWMYSLARTERRVDELETIRMLTSSAVFGKLRPLQFPFTDTAASPVMPDYWMGAEYPDSYELPGDKLSIALFNSDLIQVPAGSPANAYCGIFIYNWDEVIPHKEETTGITFHYDQPNAKAPQNLLLAVHPGCKESSMPSVNHWQVEDLLYTLLDTIEMSKIRLVEPDHFKENEAYGGSKDFELFKWLLPAVVGEITPHTITKDNSGAIISNEFQGAKDSFQQVSFEYNPLGQTLTDPQTGSAGPVKAVKGSLDIGTMPASLLLQDQNAQNYLSQQEQVAAISATIELLQSI